MKNPLREEKSILNDLYIFITVDQEVETNQRVKGFGIKDSTTGKIILPVIDSFHLNDFAEAENVLRVHFCVYPNREPEYIADINPANGTFVYEYEEFLLQDFETVFKELLDK